ncbi:MAG: hypothetical protein HYT72_02285 [Candidatus Aenigmarchaeota archaeon]|nr:hypothetical protein [Candidatus Aenigmarchaeota archaeon]
MAYKLFVQGREGAFSDLRSVAGSLKSSLSPEPIEFTVQAYGTDGNFAYAFGGRARLRSDAMSSEITYNGWTTDSGGAKADMVALERYLNLLLIVG